MTYSEKLKDPRWQRKRLKIMERDQFCCQNCFEDDKPLHIHHLAYQKKGQDPWDYPDEALTTLCEKCHPEAERIRYELLIELATAFFGDGSWSVLNAIRILKEDGNWGRFEDWIRCAEFPEALDMAKELRSQEWKIHRMHVRRAGEKRTYIEESDQR